MNEVIEKWCKLPDCSVEFIPSKCDKLQKVGYLISEGETPFLKFIELAFASNVKYLELKNQTRNRAFFKMLEGKHESI